MVRHSRLMSERLVRQSSRWWLVTVLVTVLVAVPVAVPVSAQEPLGRPERERAEELRERAQDLRERAQELRLRVVSGRARLGVVLGPVEEVDGRTGVRIRQVVPDAPAERAGMRAGDLLLSLNGQAVGDEPGRVTRFLADVEPGDTVAVVVRRDGADHTLQVETDPSQALVFPGAERLRIEALRIPEHLPDMAAALRDLPGLHWQLGRHRLELVGMNPGLGRYFGVSEGVLVADVAEGSRLNLRAGDVIVAVGGRDVRDAAHARSILASYRADEELEITIVRDRQRLTVRGSTGREP
jgi:serine protease Do